MRETGDVLKSPFSFLRRWFAIGAFVCMSGAEMLGATVTIIPNADASLIGAAPGNSMGGLEHMVVGITQNNTTNRALMRFDITNSIPAGSKILSTELKISITKQAVETPAGATLQLHRMLRAWGEGTNLALDGPGLGEISIPGDANWRFAFSPTNAWTSPGGLIGTDFTEAVSTSVFVDTTGEFTFEPTFELDGDVQFFLDHPESNFGWMIKAGDEIVNFAAKRIASREFPDPDIAPKLTIHFAPPPRIIETAITNGAIQFSFEADAGATYSVEGRQVFGGTNTWNTVTNFGFVSELTNFTVQLLTNGAQRFFRVRMD